MTPLPEPSIVRNRLRVTYRLVIEIGAGRRPACVAELMLVTPWAFRTDAVVRMMKKAIALEKNIPTVVSSLIRSSSGSPPLESSRSGRRALLRRAVVRALAGERRDELICDRVFPTEVGEIHTKSNIA